MTKNPDNLLFYAKDMSTDDDTGELGKLRWVYHSLGCHNTIIDMEDKIHTFNTTTKNKLLVLHHIEDDSVSFYRSYFYALSDNAIV